jgi:serine O-acetyltransferase
MLGLGTLRRVMREVRTDVAAARDRDPAARNAGALEILLSWGGVQAVLSHRVAHALHENGVPILPMAMAYATRSITASRFTRRQRSATTSSSTTARVW